MDTELDAVHATEDAKLRYQTKLEELREQHRGNPGQQEALASFGYADPAEGLDILNRLESAGLTPWDVHNIYGPMWKTTSEQSRDQQSLQRSILGHSSYPKPGDLIKVANYVINEKKGLK